MSPFGLSPSFFQHLNELRSRLIKSGFAFLVAVLISFNYVGKILPIIIQPAGHLVFTSPGEAFSAYMTLSVVMGAIASSPIICYQLWAFVGSALKPSEKKFVAIFGPLSLFFFLCGCAFAYWVAIPMAYKFLMSFSSEYLVPMVTIDHYFDFLGNMILAFGFTFELPLILAFFAAIGIATPEFLRQKRRHAIIVILIIAAVLTPSPDVASQLLLAVPLFVLYEVGIIFVKIFQKKRVL